MYIRKRYGLLFFLILILSGVMVHAEVRSDLYVTDDGGMLSEHDETYIETLLSTIEKQSTIEFAVVTVDSLHGSTIENVARSTFQSMGLGKSDKNNGLLLIISLEDRRYRMEVGYGLEGVITNTVASNVIKELKTPFRNKEYDVGIKEVIFKTVDYLNSSGKYIINIKKYKSASNKYVNPSIITFIVVIAVSFLINKLKFKKTRHSYTNSYDDRRNFNEDDEYNRDQIGRYVGGSVHKSSGRSDGRKSNNFSSDSSYDSSSDSGGFGGGDSGGGGSSGGW